MKQSKIEILLGSLVLAAAFAFLGLAWQSGVFRTFQGYEVTARFNTIENLNVGSDVRIGGVKVGEVTGRSLDARSYQAVVRLMLDETVRVPADSLVIITNEGLSGNKYLRIIPGGNPQTLAPGEQFANTQDAVSLEDLIGRAIFSSPQ